MKGNSHDLRRVSRTLDQFRCTDRKSSRRTSRYPMGRHVAGQLVRCGTSPAPNYEEACAAESRADFAHKLSICLKELRESRCWIRLIIKTEMLKEHKVSELLEECNQLCNIIARSIVTTKRNKSAPNRSSRPSNE